ncbi:MAG: sigma-70 family RNA polymerase sigma factor [Planctomycetes bacterium]|nr:sigma-70 family RNA polymerase sigma factor [Planctomycetota bacterium]
MDPHAELDALLSHDRFVRAVARQLLADESRVDDVVQGTWLAALRCGPTSGGSLRRWLATVARRLALDELRSDRRRSHREQSTARSEVDGSLEELAAREAARTQLLAAVVALPEPYRTVVLLRYYDGLPPRVIARRLELPVDTVKTRLRRALDQLRERVTAAAPIGGRPLHGWMAALAGTPSASLPFSSTGPLLMISTKTKGIIAALALAGLGAALWPMISAKRISTNTEPQREVSIAAPAPSPGPADAEPAVAQVDRGSKEQLKPTSKSSEPAPRRAAQAGDTGALTLEVRSPRDGSPVPQVGIRLLPILADLSGYVKHLGMFTNSHGIARFEAVPAGRVLVQVDRRSTVLILECAPGSDRTHRIDLLKGTEVALRILDFDGRPAAGASVWLGSPREMPIRRVESGRADSKGEITLFDVSEDVVIVATSGAAAPSEPWLFRPKPGATEDRVEKTLTLGAMGARIEGRVVDRTGHAVAGARLLLGDGVPWVAEGGASETPRSRLATDTVCDEQGRFRFFPLAPGTWPVAASAEGHGFVSIETEVVAGGATNLEIALPVASSVEGRVSDGSGRPLEGASITCGRRDTPQFRAARSLPDGTYKLTDFGPGSFEITASFGEAPSQRATVVVDEGATVRFDPVFPASRDLVGRVLDDEGAPLAGWLVRVIPQSIYGNVLGVPFIATDGAGRFEARHLGEGEFVVEALEPPPKGKKPDPMGFDPPCAVLEHVSPGLAEVVLRVTEASRPTVFVEGSICDPDGRPLPAATVSHQIVGERRSTQFSANGSQAHFRVGPIAAARKHTLTFECEGFPPLVKSMHDLVPGRPVDLGEVRLERGAVLTLRLRRVGAELPSNLQATARLEGSDGGSTWTTFDRQGALLVSSPLARGLHAVTVSGEGIATERFEFDAQPGAREARDVELAAGVARSIQCTRKDGKAPLGTLEGSMIDASGATVWSGSFGAHKSKSATLPLSLRPGTYTFSARDTDGAKVRAEVSFKIEDGTSPIALVLE